ncbi:MAG: TetR/AcrR family transcriptional regulator [Bacteroidota bacterium]
MNTRDKITRLADQLIRKQGYNAFSYKDLSEPMQVRNAAIHYHFPAKADVGIAVIDKAIREFDEYKQQWSDLPENEQLEQFAQMYMRNCKQGLICLMGSLAPDYLTLPEAMQMKVRAMGQDLLDWLTFCLQQGREKDLFRFSGEAYDRALLVASTLLSALLLNRVLGEDTFQRMYDQLLSDLLKK